MSANIAQQQANFPRQVALLTQIHKELGSAGLGMRVRASPSPGTLFAWNSRGGQDTASAPTRHGCCVCGGVRVHGYFRVCVCA